MDEHWTDPSVGWKCHMSFLIWVKIVCMGLLQCHIEDTVKKSLSYKESLYCYCTWQVHKVYVQAPDVAWNKIFKANCMEKYNDWLAAEEINT